jgi:hypothetical protein
VGVDAQPPEEHLLQEVPVAPHIAGALLYPRKDPIPASHIARLPTELVGGKVLPFPHRPPLLLRRKGSQFVPPAQGVPLPGVGRVQDLRRLLRRPRLPLG